MENLTVKELIEVLKKFPEDMPIICFGNRLDEKDIRILKEAWWDNEKKDMVDAVYIV